MTRMVYRTLRYGIRTRKAQLYLSTLRTSTLARLDTVELRQAISWHDEATVGIHHSLDSLDNMIL